MFECYFKFKKINIKFVCFGFVKVVEDGDDGLVWYSEKGDLLRLFVFLDCVVDCFVVWDVVDVGVFFGL